MAGAFIAGLAGDMLANTVGSLVSAGANAINQKVDFENNKYLQNASFNHDKEMLNAQIEATKRLQADMIAIKQGVLTLAASPLLMQPVAINAPMTKVLDWSGTRYWAPNATSTTSMSGGFTNQAVHRTTPNFKTNQTPKSTPSSGSSARSNSTQLTSLSSHSSGSSRSSGSTVISSLPSSNRTRDWVNQQNFNLEPHMPGSLRTAFVTPPSSTASSSSTVSTVPKNVLDSWTSAFNTRRQPLFAHLRRRGESNV
uniref:Minor structural protein n=1 Tax=Human calicivirus strain Arg320 TaxID=106586 RepID=Q9PYA6_NORV|nr:unknown [Human calicivirus strain Arg320]